MKLYVWRGKDVLRQWSSGHAIAYAETIESARYMLWQQIREHYAWWDLSDEDDAAYFNEKIAFLFREPEVYTSPIAFAIQGSE